MLKSIKKTSNYYTLFTKHFDFTVYLRITFEKHSILNLLDRKGLLMITKIQFHLKKYIYIVAHCKLQSYNFLRNNYIFFISVDLFHYSVHKSINVTKTVTKK